MRLLLLAVVLAFQLTALPTQAADEQKAVLVTGASSGIGRTTAELLADNGYYVYAGARKQKDLDALNAIDNITAVRLDVTKQDEIDAAVALIAGEGRGLYGLVNNAGVAIAGPQTEVPLDEFQWLMDVNVYGVYRVTQAFAPLIIESKGHISNISSISGTMSFPMFAQYAASKHAVEALTEGLAGEVAHLGVTVSLIEPGNYNSKIGDTGYARLKDKPYAQPGGLYGEQFAGTVDYLKQSRDRFKAPDEVAEAILHALGSDDRHLRYMVVPEEGEANWVIGNTIRRLTQFNTWQAYSYSRDELVAKLDQALGGSTAEDDAAVLEANLNAFLAAAGEKETHLMFWAEDLVYTSSNGTRFGKADILSGFEDAPEDPGPSPTYSAEDTNISVHGDTAIVTFKLVGTPPEGSEDKVMYYFNTGTFMKRSGEWKAIAWQATIIPDSE